MDVAEQAGEAVLDERAARGLAHRTRTRDADTRHVAARAIARMQPRSAGTRHVRAGLGRHRGAERIALRAAVREALALEIRRADRGVKSGDVIEATDLALDLHVRRVDG